MQIEKWVDVKDYEGLYQVSNLGRVKSLKYRNTNKEKIMIEDKIGGGYRAVQLSKNGKIKNFLIHRLVYEAFVGFIPQGFQIDHRNNNKTDNRLQNLQLLTPRENNKKRYIDNPMLRYCTATKIKCLTNGKIYNSQSEASRELNLWLTAINRVLKGKCKHTGGYSFEYVDGNNNIE